MPHTLKTALQLYTIKNEVQKDYVNALTQVAEMGYEGVEIFNYGGYSAVELKGLLNSLGLQAANTHVSLDIIEAAPPKGNCLRKGAGLAGYYHSPASSGAPQERGGLSPFRTASEHAGRTMP